MDVGTACVEIARRFRDLPEAGNAEAHETFAAALIALDGKLREHAQELTRGEIDRVTGVLNSNAPLTREQLALIKAWIVGDAEAYAKAENNAPDWRAEMERLVAAIEQSGRGQTNLEALLRLRGLLRDAIRTAQDLHYYLDNKERVDRFDEATRELDRDERRLLIEMLYLKLKSEDQ